MQKPYKLSMGWKIGLNISGIALGIVAVAVILGAFRFIWLLVTE